MLSGIWISYGAIGLPAHSERLVSLGHFSVSLLNKP